MRRCKFTQIYENGKTLVKPKVVECVFHGWSTSYEKFENRPAQYPVAIVEDKNGKVHIPYAGDVEFLDESVDSDKEVQIIIGEDQGETL
jgi:hypothetical protein